MGKDRDIKTLAKLIGGKTAHHLRSVYGNPLHKDWNRKEVDNYRRQIPNEISGHNWNDNDKIKIKQESKKELLKELKKPKFSCFEYPVDEIDNFLDNSIKEFFE